ncbi:MAG: RNA polymerase sigma factor [Gemmataceae bacterium]
MNPRNERDEWLMAQAALGQREALEPLVRRYAGPLVGFIRRLVRDTHRSEELFQEVFLAVWQKRHQYQFPRPFKPWLYAIALNKCRADFRSPSRPMVELEHDSPAMPTAPDTAPADAAIAGETAELVSRAVYELPPQQRLVVALRVWEGLSYSEIAQMTGRTEATVRSNMHHGLAALRKAMAPHMVH